MTSTENTQITIHDETLATYIDWAGEEVTITRHQPGEATYTPETAVTVGETEHGGSYTVAEAVETLEHIQAPAEIIEWVRA